MFFSKLFGFLGKNLAMDLGTANTLLYSPKDGIVLNEPSVVALDVRNENILAVGREAKEYLGRTPERIRAVRPLKDGVIADFEVTKAMIAYFIRKVITGMRIVKPRMVICVPAGITQVEKRAVRESAQSAGAREVFLIEEPMAAAIGADLPITEPTSNMVVDIGGGTTDKMDEAILQHVKRKYNMLIGESSAEDIKMTIGSAYPLDPELVMDVKGRDLVSGIPQNIVITSEEVRKAISEPVDSIVQAVRIALEQTPPGVDLPAHHRGGRSVVHRGPGFGQGLGQSERPARGNHRVA